MNKELAKDLNDLLDLKRAGHMGRWEYSSPVNDDDPVNGIGLWKKFLKNHPEYYLVEAERQIAQIAATEITKFIKGPVCLVSLGPGEAGEFRSKELVLTSHFNEVSEVIVIDAEPAYITASILEAKAARPETIIRGIQTDFFQGFNLRAKGTVLATMFGGTLFNEEGFADTGLPIQTTVNRLKAIRTSISKGYFFLTADQNDNGTKIERAYAGQCDFAKNLLHRFNRDVGTSYNPGESSFRVEWHPQSALLAHYLTIGGREYHFNNSYKMPAKDLLDCAEKAGFKCIDEIEVEKVTGYLYEAV